MVERRSIGEASRGFGEVASRGTAETTSQKPERPPPVPPTDHKLVARQGRWIFSTGVIIVLMVLALNRFTTYFYYYYIGETFIPYCLLPQQAAIIRNHIDTFYNVQVLVGVIPAILADNYIRKEWLFKIMMAIGSFSGAVLCYLATICAQYVYSRSFHLKENLFISFIVFQSTNELGRSLLISLLFDQIVNLKDFMLDTSKLFSVFYLSKEFCRLVTFCIAICTSTSKTAAAKGQILPPILSLGSVFIFIFITWWKYPLISYPPYYHGIWKILGCLKQKWTEYVVRNIFHWRSCKPLIAYSETTHKETKVFWNIQLVLICGIPYYYCLDVIGECSFSKRVLTDDPREKAIQKVYGQCMRLAFLIFSQFIIFPLVYRTSLRRIVSSPLRRMVTCYGVVGLCGIATFAIVSVNQRHDPGLFHATTSKVVSLHNLLNETVKVEISNEVGGDPLEIHPFERHLIVLKKAAPLQISLRSIKLGVDDYRELKVYNNDAFVVTIFGLEKLEMNELEDRGDVRHSRIFVFCLMIVCRGSVSVECNGHSNMFELHKFGIKYKMDVNKESKCKIQHYTIEGVIDSENNALELTASMPIYYVAAIEDAQQRVSIKLLTKESKPAINPWALLSMDLISSWANMIFEIAFCQFVLIESPFSCRTIIIAIMLTYQNFAHMSRSQWLIENGLVSERNGIIFIAIYLVGFIWFLTRMSRFNTVERIKQLYLQDEEDELKFYESAQVKHKNPKTSFASGDTSYRSPAAPING